MKDLYGKFSMYHKRPGLFTRVFEQNGPVLPCAHALEQVFRRRPLLIPALLMITCSVLCYWFSSFIPSVIISLTVILSGLYHAFVSDRRKTGRISVLAVVLLFSSVLVYIGLFIGSRLNAEPPTGEMECVVTRSIKSLSGELDLMVRLRDGPAAKVRLDCDHEDFIPGDELTFYGKVSEPDKAGNPGEFDYREHLRKQGILYVIYCDRYSVNRKAGFPASAAGMLQNLFYRIRKGVFDSVTGTFDEEFKALTAAVCLGDRSLISDRTERDFKLSCCSHLLAVSGTHFSGFLVCMPAVLKMLNIRRKKALIVQAVFCVFIGCLTGWSDSVTRAAVMSICLFADREWVSALCLAAVLMIGSDPFCALSSGFQMSFCAAIAIKTYNGRISDLLIKIHLPESAAKMISTAVSASLGIIPFWSDISMRPDIEHLAVQIAGSFVAGAACAFFIPCVVLCSLFPWWSRYMSAPLLVCLKGLMRLVSAGSGLSAYSGRPIHLSRMLLVLLGVSVFLFMLPPSLIRRMFFRPVAAVLAFVIGIEAVGYIKQPDCRIIFADVGQGDCCLVITPDTSCLIDAGTYKEGSTTVCDLLDYYGIYSVDACLMSHWDADHAGGIAALCENGRTVCIYTSYVPSDNDSDKDVEEFFDLLDNPGIKPRYLSQLSQVMAGDRIVLSDRVYLDVLYPSEISGGGNDASMVVMLHVIEDEDTSILFTGDIGMKTESYLISSGLDLDCDILKVAHHGSKYSSCEEFIDYCSPDIAVISVGARNFYGHPAPDTLERLGSYGCKVLRTDIEGAVMLEY